MPLIMIVSCVLPHLWDTAARPGASIFMGKQDKESEEKTLGKLLYAADHHFCHTYRCTADLDPIFIFGFDMDVRGRCPCNHHFAGALLHLGGQLPGVERGLFLKIKKKNLGLTPKIILPCLALGIATFIMQASESVISVCFKQLPAEIRAAILRSVR